MALEEIVKKIKSLPTYIIEVGVISGNSKRNKTTVKVGITNAELMFIHEHGSPLHNLPARPVLQMTIDWANANLVGPTISKCVTDYINSNFDESTVDKNLQILCMRMENYARDLIYSNDGRLAPNAPSVAKRKKGNHPLFDTGQLARSITCQLIKI